MEWWLWFIIGLSLLAAEIFLPLDFFLFFIGLSFICSGALSYFSIIENSSTLFTITGIVAIISLFTLRPILRNMFKGASKDVSNLEGQFVEVTDDINPGEKGPGSMNGSSWQVHNKTSGVLKKGSSQKVSSSESITLIIE